MRSLRLILLFVIAFVGSSARAVFASSDGSLATLGLPELAIQVSDSAFTLPSVVMPGRTLITVSNVGTESRHSMLLKLPENRTVGELLHSDQGDLPPVWFFESTFPGFVAETPPGDSRSVVVDLDPGLYLLIDDFSAIFLVPPIGDEGSPVAVPTPAETNSVELTEFSFTFGSPLTAGPQVLAVTNNGAQVHEIQILRSPVDGITNDQVMAAMMSDGESADGIDLQSFTSAGGLGSLSPGGTAWAELDLELGTYVAMCFVFDPAAMTIHAAEGMVQVFVVN